MKKKNVIVVLVFLIMATIFRGTAAYAADNIVWKLHTPTILPQTGSNYEFLLGDYNKDGIMDLYYIAKNNTGSHKTEVHVLNGQNNFQSHLLQTSTPVQETGSNYEFELGDYNKDGTIDLYYIAKNNTGSNKTEVHVLNGQGNFQSHLLQTSTSLHETPNVHEFIVGDYNRDGILDLYYIAKDNTGSNKTEVHVLNGQGNFQMFSINTSTPVQETGSNYEFKLGDYNQDGTLDVYYIAKNNTGSNKTEVHVLNGQGNFQSHLLQTSTPLQETYDNYQFILGPGKLNVYAIAKSGTSSGKTEVHVMAIIEPISVGAVGVGKYKTLGNCEHDELIAPAVLVNKFINSITYDPLLGDPVATKSFIYLDEHAWESDLLTANYTNIDDVDFGVFSGHGFVVGKHPGVNYNSLHLFTLNSNTNFHPSGETSESADLANADSQEIYWGNNAKTKWVATFSCNFLNTSGPRWNTIMGGVHLVMGFGSVMYVNNNQGSYYGEDLYDGKKVKDAFFDSCYVFQPDNNIATGTICRVLGANISANDTIYSYSRKPSTINSGNDSYSYWTITVHSRF